MLLSLTAASLGACAFAAATVLQQRAASCVPPGVGTGALLVRLVRKPSWAAGKGLDVVAVALQTLALARGSFIAVQSVLAAGVVIALALDAALDRRRLGSLELTAAGCVVVGTSLLVAVARPGRHRAIASLPMWLAVLAVGGIIVAAASGKRPTHSAAQRATVFAIAAACCFAVDAAFLKLAGAHRSGLSVAVAAAGFLVTAAVGNVLVQRAFHAGPLVASGPALAAAEPIAAILLGITLFHERLHGHLQGAALGALGLCLLVAGIGAGSRFRQVGVPV